MSPHILIGGGTGFIGRHLVKLLTSKNYKVTVITRKDLPDSLAWDRVLYNGIPEGVESVINLSGENVLNFFKRWNKSFRDEVYKSRVDTTRSLANAIDNAKIKPKSFITISGVGIYPTSKTAVFDEDTKVEEFDFLSKLCHDWEAASQLEKSPDCRVVNIRSGVVLNRDGGMIEDLLPPFRLGIGGHIASGKQFLPWIHMKDLVNLIAFCVENDVSGKLNGVAPETITNKQFTEAFAKALKTRAPFPVAAFLFNMLYGKERAKMITEGQAVTPKRTLETGFKYTYPDIQSACETFSIIDSEQ